MSEAIDSSGRRLKTTKKIKPTRSIPSGLSLCVTIPDGKISTEFLTALPTPIPRLIFPDLASKVTR